MCGIFGATKKEQFLTLLELNQKRGIFATSVSCVLNNGDLVVHKWGGNTTTKIVENFLKVEKGVRFYLGHTQAPTSSQRLYSKQHAHPFNTGHYTIAHNGVLTNFDELREHFKLGGKKWSNPVDSSIIPVMLVLTEESGDNHISNLDVMSKSFSLLEGTFGLWIYDSVQREIYLARNGSTVYANIYTSEFSSVKFKGSEPLNEGIIYQITPEGITSVTTFDHDSPFFT
ncbi:MAG: hypothetical protein EB127_01495 [Alphaproteobacteria bacterium]|nr:hypothetical protein [Alphaproteobacteria bacterium]